MSTLRINNIEAQSIPASPTIDEKVKVTNSSGDILVNIDGKTSGITTIGINTTDGNIKFDANSNVLITGILTATTLAGNFTPDSLEIGSNIKLGNAGVITATNFKSGVTNVHNLGVTLSGGQLDVGSNIKVGTAGVITATSFVGSGANLTSLPAQATIANNADNRVITGGSGVNLNGEEKLNWNGQVFGVGTASPNVLGNDNMHTILSVIETSGTRRGQIELGDNQNVNGGGIGDIHFVGHYQNSGHKDMACVKANASGTTSGQRGAYLSFETKSDGTAAIEERLRITSTGKVNIGDTQMSQNIFNIEDGTAAALDIASHGSGGDTAYIGVKKSSGGGLTIGISNRDIIFKTGATYSNGTVFDSGTERLRFGSSGQIGVGGANYGTARQTIVSNGSGSAVSWSSNPFLLDMDSLGDLDYDGVFLRYREVTVSGNGLVYLGLCKSTTNCPAGRIGCPVGYVPGVAYNSQFRVDKVGITPWPDGSGHRYEYFAIISDYVSTGKLGIFYLTNSTN